MFNQAIKLAISSHFYWDDYASSKLRKLVKKMVLWPHSTLNRCLRKYLSNIFRVRFMLLTLVTTIEI